MKWRYGAMGGGHRPELKAMRLQHALDGVTLRTEKQGD